MENKNEDQKDKAPDNEHYDVNNPQNITQPQFNSTSTHREGAKLPAVENLNQTKEENKAPEDKNSFNTATDLPENDESLTGNSTGTDLGNGEREQEDDDTERIIPR
jgi:hypothetical protein